MSYEERRENRIEGNCSRKGEKGRKRDGRKGGKRKKEERKEE